MRVVCDDFSDDVVPGETWTATTETFSSSGVLSPGAMFAVARQTARRITIRLFTYTQSNPRGTAGRSRNELRYMGYL